MKQVLLDKLRQLDDEALTRLLTASTAGLARFIAGKQEGRVGGWVEAAFVPSKSVGIEGSGSASDIDRRLASGKVQEEVAQERHEQAVHAWLVDRQRRTTALLEGLLQFSLLDIDSLRTDTRDHARKIHLSGTFARLFPLELQFDVHEDSSSASLSPEVRNLEVKLPPWLTRTLDGPHGLFRRLVGRNDVPAVLLMLRTMVPLVSLRRNVFTSLMESYTDLVRDHVRAWEQSTGVDFAPYHPHTRGTRKRTGLKVDEALARSLIDPHHAETLILRNKRGATLTLHFTIGWNRYGHAHPNITATPAIPATARDPTTTAFIETFEAEVSHLLKVAIAQDGLIGLPDNDEEQDETDAETGRWGIMPALHALIRAFFALHDADPSDESSLEPE